MRSPLGPQQEAARTSRPPLEAGQQAGRGGSPCLLSAPLRPVYTDGWLLCVPTPTPVSAGNRRPPRPVSPSSLTPSSCQRIRTILIPLTQEELNEAARRRKEVLFLRASKSLLLGWNPPFPESRGRAQGSPGSGFQRPVSTQGRGTKGSRLHTHLLCARPGQSGHPSHLAAASEGRYQYTYFTGEEAQAQGHTAKPFLASPSPLWLALCKVRDRKLGGGEGGSTEASAATVPSEAGRREAEESPGRAGPRVEVALSKALEGGQDRGGHGQEAEDPLEQRQGGRHHAPGWAGRSMAQCGERAEPTEEGEQLCVFSRLTRPWSSAPKLGNPEGRAGLPPGLGGGLGTHRVGGRPAGRQVSGQAQAGRRPAFQPDRICPPAS